VLIDTHAHLYLEQFADDEEEIFQRARAAGVDTVLLPAIDVPSVHAAIALCDRQPGVCYAMVALHPSAVRDATDADFEQIARLADHEHVVAIGETGLDYYWDQSYDERQHDFLRRHARLAIEKDLPLVLHNRDRQNSDRSSRDLVRIIAEEKAAHPAGDRLRGVFHCFGPPKWLAGEVVDLGFVVGIGGSLTYKNSGVAEAIEDVPLDRIVLETDAPYLAPLPHRGERNEPAHVRLVAERLAEIRGESLDTVARVTSRTASGMFGLPVREPRTDGND
jgi:TatD DNase family protein